MATTRIKDLATASAMADDDYIAIDGITNGTRKVLAKEQVYSVTSSSTTSGIDARGVSAPTYMLYATNISDVTVENAVKIKVYAWKETSSTNKAVYPLEIVGMNIYNSGSTAYFSFSPKSHSASPQNTTASYLTDVYVTATAPFELSSISLGK